MASWPASRREATSCAISTVRRFVLRSRAAGDTDADARAHIFQQLIAPNGSHALLNIPAPWFRHDNPRKLPCSGVVDQVHFYGHSERMEGRQALRWGEEEALVMAYDVVILVHTMKNTNDLRL